MLQHNRRLLSCSLLDVLISETTTTVYLGIREPSGIMLIFPFLLSKEAEHQFETLKL